MVISSDKSTVVLERIEVERIQSAHPCRVYNARLPLNVINVLPQPRKTFLEIDVLGDDVAEKNLHELLRVARFDAEHCREYLNEINNVWKLVFRMEDLVPVRENGGLVFYILLDGERRYRSCIYLRDFGCSVCREQFGPGGCYKRHFGDFNVDARVEDNISPDEAIDIQASANIHHRVPPYEEAHFYDYLYKVRNRRDSKYTVTEHAKRMGRKPEAIRLAMRFCDLPEKIQEYIETSQTRWGIGIEATRLQIQGGLDERELERWIIRAITENLKVPEFRERVNRFLFNKRYDQMSLFSMAEDRYMRRSAIRMVVERHTIMAIHGSIFYLNKVLDLFIKGKLGKKDSPFSHRSPVKVFRRLIDLEAKVLPYLWQLLPQKERERDRRIIEETAAVLSRLEASLPEEPE